MNETEIPRFWFSRYPGRDGQSSGQFSKLLTEGQIRNQGYTLRMRLVGEVEVWDKTEPPVTKDQIADAAIRTVLAVPDYRWASWPGQQMKRLVLKYESQQ